MTAVRWRWGPDDVELRPAGARADGPGGDRVDDRALDRDEIDLTGLLPGALAALEDAVAALREQLAQAERRAATAEHGRDGERQRADALRDRIDTLTAELAMAEQQAEKAEARVWNCDPNSKPPSARRRKPNRLPMRCALLMMPARTQPLGEAQGGVAGGTSGTATTIHNERVRLTATILNNAALAFIVAGFIAPVASGHLDWLARRHDLGLGRLWRGPTFQRAGRDRRLR